MSLENLSMLLITKYVTTKKIELIKREEAPTGRTVTYADFVCDYHPLKSEPYQVKLTVGGDRLEYPDDTS